MRKSWIRTGAALLLAAALAGGLAAHAGAAQADTLAAAVRDTAAYVCEAAEKPQVGRAPAPSETNVKISGRRSRKAAAAARASSWPARGSPSRHLGVRLDKCSEKGPS